MKPHSFSVANSSLDLSDRAVLGPLARLLAAVRKAADETPLLLVGAAARDLDTGKVCRVVSRVWGGGAWNVRFPGDDELVERPADKLEAIEDPAQPAWKPPRAP